MAGGRGAVALAWSVTLYHAATGDNAIAADMGDANSHNMVAVLCPARNRIVGNMVAVLLVLADCLLCAQPAGVTHVGHHPPPARREIDRQDGAGCFGGKVPGSNSTRAARRTRHARAGFFRILMD